MDPKSNPFISYARKALDALVPDKSTVEAYQEEHGFDPGYLRDHGLLEEHPLYRAVCVIRPDALKKFPDADLSAFKFWIMQDTGRGDVLTQAMTLWTLVFGAGDPRAAFQRFTHSPEEGSVRLKWLYVWFCEHGDDAVLRELQGMGERYWRRGDQVNSYGGDHRTAIKAAYYRYARGTISKEEMLRVVRLTHHFMPEPPERSEVVEKTMEFLAELLETRWEESWIHEYLSSPYKGFQFFPGRTIFLAGVRRLAETGAFSRMVCNPTPGSTIWSILNHSYPRNREELHEVIPVLKEMPEEVLVKVMVSALPWAPAVEQALGWAGAAKTVAWGYAHTKNWIDKFSLDAEGERLQDQKKAWVEAMSRCDLNETFEGIADRSQLLELEKELGRERLLLLVDNFALMSERPQADEARQYARAVLGINRDEVFTRFKKRTPWVVRAIGMLPGDDVRPRYEMLQAFRKESNRYGPARRASERRMFEVALENLARVAGFDDGLLLALHLEPRVEATGTWKAGAHTLKIEIEAGKPGLVCLHGEKVLRSVAPAARKTDAFKQAVEQVDRLKGQYSRLRVWIEQAMIDGRRFKGADLEKLWNHPVGHELLRHLAFHVGDKDLLAEQGMPFGADDTVMIPHPLDLDERGVRGELQRRLLLLEWSQSIKQLFREAYRVSADEAHAEESRRFSGQEVRSGRAASLLSARGWRLEPYGIATRDFRAERTCAVLEFEDAPQFLSLHPEATTASIRFSRDNKFLVLGDVPHRLFSEAMRDVDLVVSVANTRDEAPWSPESINAVGGLIEELARKLGLQNVRVVEHFAEIRGHRGKYRVHLGSGVVHRDPGRNVYLTPKMLARAPNVSLPFYDLDGRTLDVVSKVLLLADDATISDKTTLEALEG
jgi:hypothetical protein